MPQTRAKNSHAKTLATLTNGLASQREAEGALLKHQPGRDLGAIKWPVYKMEILPSCPEKREEAGGVRAEW